MKLNTVLFLFAFFTNVSLASQSNFGLLSKNLQELEEKLHSLEKLFFFSKTRKSEHCKGVN